MVSTAREGAYYDAPGVPIARREGLKPGLRLAGENGLHSYRLLRGKSILPEGKPEWEC